MTAGNIDKVIQRRLNEVASGQGVGELYTGSPTQIEEITDFTKKAIFGTLLAKWLSARRNLKAGERWTNRADAGRGFKPNDCGASKRHRGDLRNVLFHV